MQLIKKIKLENFRIKRPANEILVCDDCGGISIQSGMTTVTSAENATSYKQDFYCENCGHRKVRLINTLTAKILECMGE